MRVPAFALVGGENKGWTVARTHLELEHGGGGRIGRNRVWDRLLRYCQETKRDGVPLSQEPDVRDSLADIYIQTEIQRLFGLRNFYLTYARKPKSYEGPQLSYYRKMTGLWMTGAILEAVGPAALTTDPTWGSPAGFLETQQRNGIVSVHPGGTDRHPARPDGAAHRHRTDHQGIGRPRARHRGLRGEPWISR